MRTKRRCTDAQPLRADLAAELQKWLEGKPANEPVWPGTWHNDAAEMVRRDLEAAGLSYADDAGKVFEFHAFRHHFISILTRSGISPKLAQSLARHSTITLTLDRYTHLAAHDTTAAVDRLPGLPSNQQPAAERQKTTGTDGRLAQKLALPLALNLARKPFIACYGLASNDASDERSESSKPNDGKDFGVSWQPVPTNDQIRPAGIEPATCGLEARTRDRTRNYRLTTCILTKLLREQTGGALSHFGAPQSVDAPLADSSLLPDVIAFLASVWSDLPPHVREAIVTLANSCKQARIVDDGDEE